ncbi:hypothetical protein [Streptomyces sp. NPDC007355]|uniref:hypothetical protein n=1 Tax=Streptomyces sp. NPDC007355 TaxID=3364778 RepID=UPI0036C695F2
MEPEVIAALIGTPAVLVAATAAWLAGRAQSRGAYHGPVDAVRRAAQREAYADLYRTGRRFIGAFEALEEAVPGFPAEVSPELRELWDSMREAQDALEHAVDMVRLEGPDDLAAIADRIWSGATGLAKRGHRVREWGEPPPPFNLRPDPGPRMIERNNAMTEFSNAHRELLQAARAYLNGSAQR